MKPFNNKYLKVPSGQIGSAWEWYHWIGLEKDINRYTVFWFFNFDLEFLKRLQSSGPLHTKIHIILLLVGITGCMVTNRNLFRQTGLQKCGKVNNWSLYYGLWEEYPAVHTRIVRIFSPNKSAPANRKKGFYTNRNPNKQEVGFTFVWSGSEFWSLFKFSKVKLKNQKHIAVDVHFKAYPMVPLSFRSNLAGGYLYHLPRTYF